jgi:hypothetical protein
MARITVEAIPNSTTVNVQDGNNINANIQSGAAVNVQVTPQARQVININKGVAGPPGPNLIGGYPISILSPSNYDALMFLDNEWTNVPQVEITDGGNY